LTHLTPIYRTRQMIPAIIGGDPLEMMEIASIKCRHVEPKLKGYEYCVCRNLKQKVMSPPPES
jgi:hypothetical protein